jgi:NAD(P)-dependent dehydrogenase (short-subunit alcohol dehydrogenase family)
MCSSPMPGESLSADSTLDPAPLQLVVAMNLFGTVYTVNAVAPVSRRGGSWRRSSPASSQSNGDRAELVALRRLGTVEDCAKVVEFLATDLSDYVTGAAIPIGRRTDAGMTAQALGFNGG